MILFILGLLSFRSQAWYDTNSWHNPKKNGQQQNEMRTDCSRQYYNLINAYSDKEFKKLKTPIIYLLNAQATNQKTYDSLSSFRFTDNVGGIKIDERENKKPAKVIHADIFSKMTTIQLGKLTHILKNYAESNCHDRFWFWTKSNIRKRILQNIILIRLLGDLTTKFILKANLVDHKDNITFFLNIQRDLRLAFYLQNSLYKQIIHKKRDTNFSALY